MFHLHAALFDSLYTENELNMYCEKTIAYIASTRPYILLEWLLRLEVLAVSVLAVNVAHFCYCFLSKRRVFFLAHTAAAGLLSGELAKNREQQQQSYADRQ